MRILVLLTLSLYSILQCSGLPERSYVPPADGELLVASDLEPLYRSYSALLQNYVSRGNVDYAAMCQDPSLERVMQGFRSVDTQTIQTREQGLAFWINAYNAFTLDVICLGYPVKSINKLHGAGGLFTSTALGRTVWKVHTFPIGKKEFTLDEIEHEILRPEFKDYRIHAGIVCASVSCPLLRSEAYVPERIDDQLNDQMKEFMASELRNRIDPETRTIYLSKIFKWFRDDFVDSNTPLLEVLWPYIPDAWKTELVDLETVRKKWKVEYLPYDWSLNGT